MAAPEDVTIESAYVERLRRYRHRARCLTPGCEWAGKARDSFADANAERRGHLNEHVIAEISKGGGKR